MITKELMYIYGYKSPKENNNMFINELGDVYIYSKRYNQIIKGGTCYSKQIKQMVISLPNSNKATLARAIMKLFKPIDDMKNHVVTHLDKNPFNNHISNLRWKKKQMRD